MAIPSSRTLLGPLTTTWTPGPECLYAVATCATCTTVWQAQTCNTASDAHDYTACWPPRSGPQSTADPGVMMGWGLYSPGYICPSGFSTAAMVSSGGPTGSWGVEYSFLSGETAIACCPTGYDITYISTLSTYGQTCITTATSATFSTFICESGVITGFGEATVPTTVSNTALTSYVMYAPLFQLNFQQSDLPPGGLSAITSGSGGTGPTASSGPTTSMATTTINGKPTTITSVGVSSQTASSSSSGGLSQGVKIGIGVGVAVAALAAVLAAIAFVFVVARRRRLHRGDEKAPSSVDGGAGDLEADKKKPPLEPPANAAEVQGREVQELDGKPHYAELPTRLPSDRVMPVHHPDPIFRVSDQNWVVAPHDGTGTWGTDGSITPSTPTRPHGNRLFELEGDSASERGSLQIPRHAGTAGPSGE